MAQLQPRSTPTREDRRRALLLLGAALMTAVAFVARAELLRLWAGARVVAEGGRLLDRAEVVLQRELYDCGPAALATLRHLLGLPPISLDSIAGLAGTTRAGTSAEGLASAALELGFHIYFTRLPGMPGPDFGPFIAWVRTSHFVVARALPDGRVLIHDPSVGRYLLERDGFERIWTGESLVTAPRGPRSATLAEPDSPVRIIATGRLP